MNPRRLRRQQRPLADRRDHGDKFAAVSAVTHPGQVRIVVLLGALQGGVVTAVVADLVEHRARHQITRRDRLVAVLPASPGPGFPVSALRVADEQQNLLRVLQLEGEHQAGVVDPAIDVQRQRLGGMEPVMVDAPPRGVRNALLRQIGLRRVRRHPIPRAEESAMLRIVEGLCERPREPPPERPDVLRAARMSAASAAAKNDERARSPWPGNDSAPCGSASASRSARCGGPSAKTRTSSTPGMRMISRWGMNVPGVLPAGLVLDQLHSPLVDRRVRVLLFGARRREELRRFDAELE